MKDKDKGVAIYLTLLIDFSLLSLLVLGLVKTQKDYVYIICVFLIHIVFIYGVYYNNTSIIDICHLSIPASLCIAPLLDSIYLKAIHLVLLLVIQILWVCKGYCIIGSKHIQGCGDLNTIIAAIWTLFLGYNLYHPFT